MTFTFPCTHGKHKSFNSEPWSLHQLIQAAGYQRSEQLWNWSLAKHGLNATRRSMQLNLRGVVENWTMWNLLYIGKIIAWWNWRKPMDSHVMIVPRLYWLLTSLLQVASTMPWAFYSTSIYSSPLVGQQLTLTHASIPCCCLITHRFFALNLLAYSAINDDGTI